MAQVDGLNAGFRGPSLDWFSSALNGRPGFFVSGERRVVSNGIQARVSIRSIGHWAKDARRPCSIPRDMVWVPPVNVFMRHILCVATSSREEIEDCARAVMCGDFPLAADLAEVLGPRRALIVFAEHETDGDFWVYDRVAGLKGMVDRRQYADILNRERDDPGRPSMEKLNTSCADGLHHWSRNHLQGNMSVCDLDAFRDRQPGSQRVLIELKSSNFSVAKLWPGDVPNLKLMESLAPLLEARRPLLIRSQPSHPGNLGVFLIEKVDHGGIRGRFAQRAGRGEHAAVRWCIDVIGAVAGGDVPPDFRPFHQLRSPSPTMRSRRPVE